MNEIVRVDKSCFILYTTEDGCLVTYVIKDDKVIQRRVLTQANPWLNNSQVVVEAMLKAALMAVMITALLLGRHDLAAAIGQLFGISG